MNEPAHADVVVLIPAFNEADRIAETVAAAAKIPGVIAVYVSDDGSSDETAERAGRAGAIVVSSRKKRGKGSAVTAAWRAVLARETAGGPIATEILLLDADLGSTANAGAILVEAVRSGSCDMAIGVLPPPRPGTAGGHNLVVRLARTGILRRTSWKARQPLSGQRCLTRACFEAAFPLAKRFGLEVGLTLDLIALGFRVSEIDVPIAHRVTGRDLRSQFHRSKQFIDVLLALRGRRAPISLPRHGVL